MNKEFIPSEQALALKELGFDEPCFGHWSTDPSLPTNISILDVNLFKHDWCLPAPTFSQAFDFFRKMYVLLGFIEPANGYEDKSLFAFYICDDEQNIINDEHSYSKDSSLHYKTYEEAELACLTKLIEIVKNKNNNK